MNFDLPIPSPVDAIEWVFDLPKPTWDQWFMAKVFLTLTRSNDQQTKQGAILVDWNTKRYTTGYNGHPRHTENLPTLRAGSAKFRIRGSDGKLYCRGSMVPDSVEPMQAQLDGQSWFNCTPAREAYIQGHPDKYKFMCHCETNALLQMHFVTDHAVLYVPMPSCDMCASYMLNHPTMKLRRIVYYEDRAYDNHLYAARPDVTIDKYDADKNGHPEDLLIVAAQYVKLRRTQGQEMSKGVSLTYKKA